MIDPENLRTASLYINNQLLSRGLLRDGQHIDFADPEGSDGGLQAAMGRIISVVNDLILRRDRDAEHRESLSSTLRTLRVDVQRQTTELARQTEKLDDTQRRLDISESTERALRGQLRTAEQGIHKLKDEMAKLKSLVAQTRSACANEVRKRDRQIDGLKKAVTEAGRVRGGGKNRDVMTISVTGDFGGSGRGGGGGGGYDAGGVPVGATESEGYSLRMETNEFLTELAKGLSEENEGLLALVRHTVDGLREMSGLDEHAGGNRESVHAVHAVHDGQVQDEFITYPPKKSAEELASELEGIVEHLRLILTNPSFVPIEEVEVRDEVIRRLQGGLETMEARWNDAVQLLDGWRKRMVSNGIGVGIEDLQRGLKLSPVQVREMKDVSAPVPIRLSRVQEEEAEERRERDTRQYQEENHKNSNNKLESRRFRAKSPVESLRLVSAPGHEADELGDESDSESSIFQDDLDLDDLDVEEPNVQILQISTAESIHSSPLPEPPQISPLKDSYSSGNRGSSHKNAYRKKPEDYTTIVEENTWDLAADAATAAVAEEQESSSAPQPHTKRPASPKQKSTGGRVTPPQVVDDEEEDDVISSYTASYDSPLFGKSGEGRSQAQLNRKLFSKPAASTKNTATATTTTTTTATATVTAGSHTSSSKEVPAPTRVTRSSARKSAENAGAATATTATATTQAMKRTLSDKGKLSTSTHTHTHTHAHTASASATSMTSSSTTTSGSGSQQKLIMETAKNSSSTNPSSPEKHTRSTGRATPSAISIPTVASTTGAVGGGASTSTSRLPRPHAPQSPLNMATIAAKLAASEREADAARVRAKLKAVRRSRRISEVKNTSSSQSLPAKSSRQQQQSQQQKQSYGSAGGMGSAEDNEDVDPVKKVVYDHDSASATKNAKARRRRRGRSLLEKEAEADELDELALEGAGVDHVAEGVDVGDGEAMGGEERGEDGDEMGAMNVGKRRRVMNTTRRASRVVSRRRSTLSPWELQGLIQGRVESPLRSR
ncbi:Afadin and alpha-actinin-binding-domain-containing protein [Xylaria sp. CBS 124048]|nr:Afadin and alpha-actinin-binding-domain-containing protein [Xylaria sp. CBS 124048]